MKRIISLVLVFVMLVGIVPVYADAEGTLEPPFNQEAEIGQQVVGTVGEGSNPVPEQSEANFQEQTFGDGLGESPQEPSPDSSSNDAQEQSTEEPEAPAVLTWGAYRYTLLTDGTASVCGFEGVPENEEEPFCVVIPSEINGVPITEIGERAFAANGEMEAVVLPETIVAIGDGAFEDCENLKEIGFCGDAPSFGTSFVKGADALEKILILNGQDFSVLEELLTQDLGEAHAGTVQFQRFADATELEAAVFTKDVSADNIGNVPAMYGMDSIEADVGTGAAAASAEENEGKVTASGTCGENVTWTFDEATGTLTISGSGKMEFYWEPPWDSIDTEIKNVVIQDGVTRIADYAFYGCSNLSDIYYSGNESEWAAITIGSYNECLLNATIHYNSSTSPAVVGTFNGHRYELYDASMTWTEAKAFCESKGGHLVTITSEEEQDAVFSYLEKFGVDADIWIGISDAESEGDWSHWITGEEVTYTNWGNGEPDNNAPGPQNYGVICNGYRSSSRFSIVPGQWDDVDENGPYTGSFICEYDSGDIIVNQGTFNGHKYELYDIPMTWDEAKAYCENLGGHLVTITSAEEQAFIETLLPEPYTKGQYWLGATCENGAWEWVTGEAFEYTNWDANQPDHQSGEKYAQIFNATSSSSAYPATRYKWNDITYDNVSGNNPVVGANAIGLICEYDSETNIDGYVRYFAGWNEEEQIAYFGYDPYYDTGPIFNFGAQVTEETDTSFLENVDELVGTYVLVEGKVRDDGMVGLPDFLISIVPLESGVGTVSAVDLASVTIGQDTYSIPSWMNVSESLVGQFVLYHLYNGELFEIDPSHEDIGRLTYWNAETGNVYIDNSIFYLSDVADESTLALLGNTGEKDISVRYRCYPSFVYQISRYVKPETAYGTNWETFEESPPADRYLHDYFYKWKDAYKEYANAVVSALETYAGNTETQKRDIIKAQAEAMKEHDATEYDRYITVSDAEGFKEYEDEAYEALATFFYEELSGYSVPTLNAIDPSDLLSGAEFVNMFLKNIGNADAKEYEINGTIVEIKPVIDIFGRSLGSIEIEGSDLEIVFGNSQEELLSTMSSFLEEIQSYTKKQTYLAVDLFFEETDVLNIYKVSKNFLTDLASKIENRIGVAWDEIVDDAGLGDLMQDLDTCYNYCRLIDNVIQVPTSENIEEALKNISELNEFEETSIKDAAVGKAMDSIKKAAKKMARALREYNDGTIVEREDSFWRMIFGCPVNISVFSPTGEELGYIGDDDLRHTDALEINRIGEVKEIYVLTDILPAVIITATDYGTMNVALEEYAGGTPTGRLNYYNVELEPGEEFSITPLDDIQSNADNIVLQSSNGETINASEYISIEDSAAVNINCQSEGIENAVLGGVGVYARGNPVVVYTEQQDGYDFMGWYENGTMVSDSIVYSFTARDDCDLTAVFQKDDRVTIGVGYTDGGVAIGGGTFSANRVITVLAIPDEGCTFSGWHVNGVCVSSDEEYSIEAIEDVYLEAQFVNHAHTYSNPEFIWGKDNSCSAEFTCSTCEHIEVLICTVTSATEGEYTVYTATVEFEGQTYSDSKAVIIPATGHTTHTVGESWLWNSESHWHKCTECEEKLDVATHSGGTASCTKQAVCSVCRASYGTLAQHDYESGWSQSADGHWHKCKNCSAHSEIVPHTPGAAATATTAQTCTACGYVITPALGHTHTPDTTWHTNGTYHWHQCTSCGAWVSTSQHGYSNDADVSCNTCGYIRTVEAVQPTQPIEETVPQTEETGSAESIIASAPLESVDSTEGLEDPSTQSEPSVERNESGVDLVLIALLVVILASLTGLIVLLIYMKRNNIK